MVICFKCKTPLITGQYIEIDEKPLCFDCAPKDDKVSPPQARYMKEMSCPLCKDKMKVGSLNVSFSLLEMALFSKELPLPKMYWPVWTTNQREEKFVTGQRAFFCDNCGIMVAVQ